jgi:hypothetical protein
MKKLMLLLLVILAAAPELPAQEEMIPPIPPKRSRAAKVGVFGGFTPAWLFADMKPINEILTASGGAALRESGIPLYGGGGAAYIMFVPNLRVGGMGMGGSISSTSLDAAGVRRDAEVSVGFGGLTVEYVVPVVDKLDIAFGAMLGGGGLDIVLRQDLGGAKTWSDEWGSFGSGDYEINGQITSVRRTLEGSFFVWIPSVNVEYAITGWFAVRLGGSYVGMSAPSWSLDGKHDLLGVPTSISGKGFMINAGLFVGTY